MNIDEFDALVEKGSGIQEEEIKWSLKFQFNINNQKLISKWKVYKYLIINKFLFLGFFTISKSMIDHFLFSNDKSGMGERNWDKRDTYSFNFY